MVMQTGPDSFVSDHFDKRYKLLAHKLSNYMGTAHISNYENLDKKCEDIIFELRNLLKEEFSNL
jgi:hypothetical protein